MTVGNTNDAPIAATADLGILRDTATKTLTIEDFANSVTDVDFGDEKILTSVSLQEGAGAITDNGDNTFTYTPVDGEENTTVTFAYTVSDKAGATSSSTADLLVVDAIPVGTGTEDGGAVTLAASGYSDATFTVAASEADDLASKGTFENGVFTPNANWFGSVAFDITTAAGVLPGVLLVSSVNDAPVINADTTDTSLVVLDDGGSVSGTITATDIETTDLTYTATGATKGSVSFTESGNYTYTATAGQEGSDSFTITVSDGTTSDDQTQVVTVQIGAVSVGTGSEDGGAITIIAEGYEGATITLKEDEDISEKGTLDGSVFTPAENWFGSINFDIETTDGQTLPGVLVVSSVNDDPVIGVDTSNTALTTDEDTAVSGTINATDVETSADNLTYAASVADKGSVTFTNGGNYTYTPNANVNGTDTFTVTVSDGDKDDTVVVNVTIDAVDDAPTLTVTGSDIGITEGAASANSTVLNATAQDIDSDDIVFSLSGTDADSFTISSQGAVTLNEAADYETKTSYSFDVVAAAGGKEATETVTLNVIDVEEVVAKVINVSASTVTESEASTFINDEDYSSGSTVSYIKLTATLDASELTGTGSTEISGANFSISPVIADLENVSANVENEGVATQGLEYKFLSSKITGLVNDVLSNSSFGDTALASDSVLVDLDTGTSRIDSSDEVVAIFLNPKDTVTTTNFTVSGTVTLGDGSTVEQESYIVSLDIV